MRTEQELLDATIELAMLNRWACHHDRPSRRSDNRWATAIQGHAGFPDLVLSRNGLVLFRELKGYDARGRLGKLTPEQRDWARQLDARWPRVHAEWNRAEWLFDVWTPDDFESLIVPTLTARRAA